MSNNGNYQRTSTLYDTVDGYYPGLLALHDEILYLSDQTISSLPLNYKLRGNSIQLIGFDFDISLYFDNINFLDGASAGGMYMKYDFGLSDQSCINLYKHNFTISYTDKDSPKANGFGNVEYDRQVIERRHTINNIIN